MHITRRSTSVPCPPCRIDLLRIKAAPPARWPRPPLRAARGAVLGRHGLAIRVTRYKPPETWRPPSASWDVTDVDKVDAFQALTFALEGVALWVIQ